MRLKKVYREVSSVYKKLAEYTYNGLGQRTALTRYDTGENVKLHTEYSYLSNVGWLTYVENRKQVAAGNVISYFKYYDTTAGDGHDCVGNRTKMIDPDSRTDPASSLYFPHNLNNLLQPLSHPLSERAFRPY